MATILSGQIESTDISAIQKKDLAEAIAMLEPSKVPLTVLLNQTKKAKCTNPKFEWNEDERKPKWDAVNNAAGITADDTTIEVDNYAYFNVGDLVKVPRTGEVMRVTVASASPITVVRGSGAAALVDNEPLMILAGSNEEGSSYPESKIVDITSGYNYTQIIKNSLKFTGTQLNTDYYGGDQRAYQRAKLAIEHAEDIERAFWFGTRSLITSGTNARRTTGGVFEFLTTNVVDAGGVVTEFAFEEFLEKAFQYGSTQKYAFCSSRVISVINLWGKDKMQVLPKDKTYGIVITKYISPHGELNLVHHPMFEGNIYGYYMAVLDLADECVQYRYLQNRDTKLFKDQQAPGTDGIVDYFQSEVGLQFKQEKRHALYTNVRM